jgi:hypothetical protein
MRAILDWVRTSFGPPHSTDLIVQALHDLNDALEDADAQGHAFTPEARLARTALRAINWR